MRSPALCWRRLVERTYREGDSTVAKDNKRLTFSGIFCVPFIVIAARTLGQSWDWVGSYAIAAWGMMAVATVFLLAMIYSSVDFPVLVSRYTLGVLPLVLLMDWGDSHSSFPSASVGVVIVLLDVSLVANAPPATVRFVLSATLLWIVVRSAESGYRYGLFAARPTDPQEEPTAVCDCADPPCAFGFGNAVYSALSQGAVLLLDFYATRMFANGQYHQLAHVEAAVRVTERITEELCRYNVEGAEAVVNSSEGAMLPVGLRQAYEQLLQNLCQYRPFLPDAVLYGSSPASPLLVVADGSEPPEGDVSIVFTDVQSSTALWEMCPRGMFEGLRIHNRVIRSVAARFGGYEVKTIGDSFMLAFADPANACRFALAAQTELVSAKWPLDLENVDLCAPFPPDSQQQLWRGLRIRIGIHTGAVQSEENPVTRRIDYFGPVVNVAARVEGVLRHGGLTGVTDAVLDSVRLADIAVGFEAPLLLPLGEQLLRGTAECVNVTVLLPQTLSGRAHLITQSGAQAPAMVTQSVGSGSSPSLASSVGLLALRLRRSNATCVATRASLDNPATVEKDLQLHVALVERAADTFQGTVATVMSEMVLVTFNAVTGCPDHMHQSLQFIGGMRVETTGFSIGGCTASVLSGVTAGARGRYSTVVGGAVSVAVRLAEVGAIQQMPILAAGALGEYFAMCHTATRVQLWICPPRRFLVWSVTPFSDECLSKSFIGRPRCSLSSRSRTQLQREDTAARRFCPVDECSSDGAGPDPVVVYHTGFFDPVGVADTVASSSTVSVYDSSSCHSSVTPHCVPTLI